MKKNLILLTFLLAFCALPVLAQRETRIRFAKGKTSAVITGRLNGFHSSRNYAIRVRAGQVLRTENIGHNHITLAIEGPPGSNYEQEMAADCHAGNLIDRTAPGVYRITVTECRKAEPFRGTFKFKISVE
jgi:hypothetical protein